MNDMAVVAVVFLVVVNKVTLVVRIGGNLKTLTCEDYMTALK